MGTLFPQIKGLSVQKLFNIDGKLEGGVNEDVKWQTWLLILLVVLPVNLL